MLATLKDPDHQSFYGRPQHVPVARNKNEASLSSFELIIANLFFYNWGETECSIKI